MIQGTVIRSTGSWYQVLTEQGEDIRARIVGKFRLDGKKLTNPVAVGDLVEMEMEAHEEVGIIRNILPRKNYVVRQSPRRKHDMHLMASNIDQAIVIVTIVSPKLKQGFIDRFLLMTEPFDIPSLIVFNKADIYSEEDLGIFAYLEDLYESIGYKVLLTSALEGIGIDELKSHLEGKTTLVSGQSGVGKSSLINTIAPNLDLRTQELSDYSGKGQHTTTFAEMFQMNERTRIIDTPGIKSLSFNFLTPMDVAHNFREFFELSDSCRFGGNCLHRNEPGCAVKAALEEGTVSELRYVNYLTMLEEMEEQNHWERHK